jgi:hypothetical protein
MRKSSLSRTLAAMCIAGGLGLFMGACEDPFPDNQGSERICASGEEDCTDICTSTECSVDSGIGCEGVAVAYDDQESCEAGEAGVGTILDVGCGDPFGLAGNGKFIACCCAR